MDDLKKKKREELSEVAFYIISFAGEAKSLGVEAIQDAKDGKFEEALNKLKEAKTKFTDAAHKHLSLIQKEAQGEEIAFMLLFMHAEDILLTTETFLLLVKEHIAIHQKFKELSDAIKK